MQHVRCIFQFHKFTYEHQSQLELLVAFCSPLCSIKGTGKHQPKIWSPSWNVIKSWSPNFSQKLQLFETETGPFCWWLVEEREDAKHPEMLNHGRKYISWAPRLVHQLSVYTQSSRWICNQGNVGVQQVLVSMVSATAIRSLFWNWNWT